MLSWFLLLLFGLIFARCFVIMTSLTLGLLEGGFYGSLNVG